MTEDTPDYSGMTLNERLFHAGLVDEFDAAVVAEDVEKAVAILEQVRVERKEAKQTVEWLIADSRQ